MEQNSRRLEQLIVQCQTGSREAKEALILEIQDRVHYHCVKILRNKEDALDATQDILLAVLRGLDGLERPASFYPWLHRIIARTCAKNYAKEHREILLEDSGGDLESYESLDDQMVPEKVIDNEETRRMIVELVDALPPAQRMCVLMYYYDELSIGDIAAAMETPENTVKSRLNYARKAIKEGVDRYLAKGIKLYAFTPLPYIQYFLQKEAEEIRLAPAAIVRIQQAVLAAGAAGAAGAAAVGGASTGVGAAVGASMVHKGLLALAGLALVGGLGGAVLLHHPAPSPAGPVAPPAVEEAILPPVEEGRLPSVGETVPPAGEEPVINETPLAAPIRREFPAAAAPEPLEEAPLPLSPAASLPSPEAEPFPSPEAEPIAGLAPAIMLEPEFLPEPVPEPEAEPERKPEKTKRPQDDDSSNTRPDPSPSQPDEPDSDPVKPEEPEPISLQPNRNIGSYLGENEEGIHEFEVVYGPNYNDWDTHFYPFLPGHYYSREEVSDPSRITLYAGNYICGKAPGTCEVRYYVSENWDGPFELKAIAYVEVLPEEPLTPDYDWGGYQGTGADGAALFKRSFQMGETETQSPLKRGSYYAKAESSDPGVMAVDPNTHRLRAVAPGSAEIRYYTRWVEGDPWTLAAVVQAEVLESLPPEPEVVERRTMSAGYGYNTTFQAVWRDELPEGLAYTSSKPSVARVIQNGRFSTVAPGSAVLTATLPGSAGEPDRQYVLEVQVDDAFQWTYQAEDLELTVGETKEYQFTYQMAEDFLGFVTWKSADPLIAGVSRADGSPRCEITGVSPGTTEVTARIRFDVPTVDGAMDMFEEISFQVQVNEAPEDDRSVVRKELEKFGYCSGYGWYGGFSSLWRGTLPDGLSYSSSDPDVAYIDIYGDIYTLSAGSVVLTAAGPDGRYELALTVEDRFDWEVYVKDSITATVEYGGSVSFSTIQSQKAYRRGVTWTSSDPSVFTVLAGSYRACSLRGQRPGNAVLTGDFTFRVNTAAGSYDLHAFLSVDVTVEYYMETEVVELTEFGICSGYGYTASFADYFPDLPEGLTYGSNDHSVAEINNKGEFTTMKAGRAVLSGYEEFDPSSRQYAIIVEVQDSFDWTCSIEGLTMEEGDCVAHGVTGPRTHDGVSLQFAYWSSSNAEVVGVKSSTTFEPQLEAKRPGTAEVKGSLTLKTPYCNGTTYMYEDVTFQVTVREKPPEETAADAQDVLEPDSPEGPPAT